ncbi:thiamine pyrophosphate-binding protein [Nocardioides sp. AE5]|uniref:thiamine pyrophosphate-binding protein n=1 Tax=Nocardioides sp. AE5 TaxID=2962573 RepID=UPI0028820221|nr:thiamine pyrophosphate-binding protein [Nocardioides sp. AE5]MDT0202691.1 thiamine pyrophosphate-binding protein [Nocardioides sp. AE5]
MLFHEAVARAMTDHGITTVFGLMGDANLYLTDAFVRLHGGVFISTSNEAGAVLAAHGYAQATGRLGVATVTHGPALTNTVTALVEAARERTPLLLLAGDTAAADRDNFQNIAQRDVVIPTGAGFEQVRTPDTIGEDLATAVRRAVTELRPIVLNIPVDFQWQEIDYRPQAGPRWVAPAPLAPTGDALDEAAGIIASAKRPVILAGRGAQEPEAKEALIRLAQRVGAPLATTFRARDLFRGEPHDLGICGTLSHEIALETILAADCIVAFGASLNKWTTAQGSMLEGRAVVQVDSERAALGRFQAVEAAVHGDAGVVADALVTMLDEAEVKPTGFASPGLAERLTKRSDADFVDQSTEHSVDHRSAILRLEAAFPAEKTLVFDGGRFIMQCLHMFHVRHPKDYVHTINFGSIGLGMGHAIGAAQGSGKPTLLVTGDGGFMLGGLAEFNTAVRHGLDLVVVVFNDGAYGAEHIQMRRKQMDPVRTTFDWPEFAAVADSLGGKGYTARNLAELDVALEELPRRNRPVLIDVKLDPDRVAVPDFY